jgi:DnaJ-class molecular chaperone
MTLYSLLDVDRGASDEEIRTAFRTLSKKHHPDRGGSADYFRQLREAYGTLGDPKRREVYDQRLKPVPSARPYKRKTERPATLDRDTLVITCSNCRRTQSVFRMVRRFVCVGCGVAYRFAQCSHCQRDSQVKESLTSWTCAHCRQTTLSSWVFMDKLKCEVCSTRVPYPRGVKTFLCPKCSTRYDRCPKCETCVSPQADLGKKKVRCPHCRKRFAR